MGSVLYDFLNDSLLFDEGQLAERFAGVSDSRLSAELVRYRDCVLANLPEIEDEARGRDDTLSVLGNAQLLSIPELTKAAFYFDTVVLTDPLFSCAPPPDEVLAYAVAMSGVDSPWTLERTNVTVAATLMRELRFAVATGYARFAPDMDRYVTRPIPVLKSDNLFASLVPQELRERYYEALRVDGIVREGNANTFRFQEVSSETSEIVLRFATEDGARAGPMWGYRFMEAETVPAGDPGKVQLRMRQKPAGASLENWVAQSVNLAAANHFKGLEERVERATGLRSGFLVDTPFEQEILAGRRRSDIETFGGDCVVNMDVPILSGVPLDAILRVRADDGLAFSNFRAMLQGKLKALRNEADPARTRAGVEDAMHELSEIGRVQIARNMQSLRKKMFFDAVLMVGSLAAVPATPWTLAGALAAVVKGREHYSSYRSQADNPAFFLWKVKNHPK